MYRCWYCGNEVVWEGDFMESDVNDEAIPSELDRVVGYYHCQNCGSDYEYRQGNKKEE